MWKNVTVYLLRLLPPPPALRETPPPLKPPPPKLPPPPTLRPTLPLELPDEREYDEPELPDEREYEEELPDDVVRDDPPVLNEPLPTGAFLLTEEEPEE